MQDRKRWIMSASGATIAALPWWTSVWPLILVCFVPLLLVEEDIRKKKEGLWSLLPYALVFFIIWNLLVTWWLARIHFAGGISVILLNSALMSMVFILYASIRKAAGGGAGVFVILWTAFEFLHHRGDLSWPWLSLGNGLAGSVQIVQWYEYTGMTGGTLWVLLVNSMVFTGISFYSVQERPAGVHFIRLFLPASVILLPPLLSLHIYKSYDQPEEAGKGFLILQPVVDPYTEKFSGMSNSQKLGQLLDMASERIDAGVDFIVAPETAIDSVWIDDPCNRIKMRIEEFLGRHPFSGMVAGATTFRYTTRDSRSYTTREDVQGRYYEVQNSVLYFGSGKYSGAYHKHFLANGVEQVPFQRLSGLAGRLSLDMGGVSGSLKPGEGASVFRFNADGTQDDPVILGSLICFESSYGEYAGEMVRKGARILLVLSNDGWFKNTGAYRQHLRLSVIRAIETRRDIIRAANTGISCHISGLGEIAGRLEWWEQGALLVRPAANDKLTFFVRSGDYLGRAALFFSILLVINLVATKIYLRGFR